MTVIDVHTHMLTLDWIELLKRHGGAYEVKPTKAGQNSIWKDGAPFMTLFPGMWDYDLRIKAMDKAKVDLAIISLTVSPAPYRFTTLRNGRSVTPVIGARITGSSMRTEPISIGFSFGMSGRR